MNNLPVAKESFIYIIVLAILSAALYLWVPVLSAVPLLLLAFVVFFFRNPHRTVPEEEGAVVSPADGKVMAITEIDEPEFLKARAVKVTIFLSIFNVHINRSPIAGAVEYTAYRPGKFLPAYKSHASELNERNTIGITGAKIKVMVHQITGLIARRIVCWSKKGDRLTLGDRFGLIKFGSCTEVILPLNVDIKVKVGDKVKGAKTVIGVIS